MPRDIEIGIPIHNHKYMGVETTNRNKGGYMNRLGGYIKEYFQPIEIVPHFPAISNEENNC